MIYINDLPNCVSSPIHLFADDCVVFHEIKNGADVTTLQADLGNIATWCDNWRMELNISKCKAMGITRTSTLTPMYFVKGIPLEPVASYKYLGVHITNNLKWDMHIDHITANAIRTLGFIRRNFSQVPSSIKLLLYKTLIWSKLEYAASIWDPDPAFLIHKLEMVQNNSTRFILCNYTRAASISSMKSTLNLQTLALRKNFSRLCLFHKIYHHPLLKTEFIHAPAYVSERLDHAHKVAVPSCHSRFYAASFLPRTSTDSNRLPASTAVIDNVDKFRSAITSEIETPRGV